MMVIVSFGCERGGVGRSHTPSTDGDEEGCWVEGWMKSKRVRCGDLKRQGDEKSGGRRVNGSDEGGSYRREKERGRRAEQRWGLAHPCLLPISTHIFSQ